MSKREGRKRKPWKVALAVVGIIFGVLAVVALVALGVTEGERREGRNLAIADVDFSTVPDGTYTGTYEGGMYEWRANEVRVTVSAGKVVKIEVVSSATQPVPALVDQLYDRVISEQSLKVDTVSGASITSKAFLKSVEIALRADTTP
jgi:uncharacterized protein with FMN-binding domain